jgi:CRP-like cAMP-binding protein
MRSLRPSDNELLRLLPSSCLEKLAPEPVELRHEVRLLEEGEGQHYAYFPASGVISLISKLITDRNVAEIATIGPEGMACVEALLGAETITNTGIVQVSGEGYRIRIERLRTTMEADHECRDVMLRYVRAFIVQLQQSVACNSLHSIEERCARWLLMTEDRAHNETFDLTQEFLAEMLGVRRASVTVVCRTLQTAGLIRYSRGVITIVDRGGLEEAACDCYRIVRDAFFDLLRR